MTLGKRLAKAVSAFVLVYIALCSLGASLGWMIDMTAQLRRDLEYRRTPRRKHKFGEALAVAHQGKRQ